MRPEQQSSDEVQLPSVFEHAGASVPPSGGGGGGSPHTPLVPPVGMRHVRPEQHCVDAEQTTPVLLQVGASTPPSDGGGGGGGGGVVATHVPVSWPTTRLQVVPAQQSLGEVHVPLAFTHFVAVQRSVPFASGMHGVPPQHSDENVH
jgi:hypothetical protein